MNLTKAAQLFLIFLVPSSMAGADVPFPPNQHPLALVHAGIRPEAVPDDPAGTVFFDGGFYWSNTYNEKPDQYVVDAETRVFDLRGGYRWTDSITASILIPVVYRGGGILDSTVKEWDDVIGARNKKRFHAEDDQFLISGTNRDGTTFDWNDTGTALGNLELSAKWNVPDYENWAVRSRVTLPTSRDTFGSESVDIALGVLGMFKAEPFVLRWGGETIWFQDTEVGGVGYRDFLHGGFFDASYQFLESWRVIAGILISSELVQSIPETPDFDLFLDFAVAYKFSGQEIGIYVRENPSSPDETTDVTVGITADFKF